MSKHAPVMFKTMDEYKTLFQFAEKQRVFVNSLQHTLKGRNLFTSLNSLATQLSQQLEEFAKEKKVGSVTHKQNQKKLIAILTQLRERYAQLSENNPLQETCDTFIAKLKIMEFPQQNFSLAEILARYTNKLLQKGATAPVLTETSKEELRFPLY